MELNKKRILLFFHGGSLNHGCEAIIKTAVKVIRRKYPDAFIALASTAPQTDQNIEGLDEIFFHNQNRGFKRFSLQYFENLYQTRLGKNPTASYHLMHEDIISKIQDFDIFLSIGGDNYCYGNIPDYYYLNSLIKKSGKKLILWGASIGTEDLKPDKIKDLKTFDQLLIRESESVKELKQAGITNLTQVADGAFPLDKEMLPLPEKWEKGNAIGFNYSPLVEKKIPESKTAVLELLKHILETTSYQLVMTPHVIQPKNNDFECMQKLVKDLGNIEKGRIIFLPDNLSASQYKGYISQMEMFVGARTHATIAAYSSAVPVMVLGYSIKSKGIAEDLFGEPKLVLDKSELSNATLLIEKFEELNKEKESIKKQLSVILPKIQELSWSSNIFL